LSDHSTTYQLCDSMTLYNQLINVKLYHTLLAISD